MSFKFSEIARIREPKPITVTWTYTEPGFGGGDVEVWEYTCTCTGPFAGMSGDKVWCEGCQSWHDADRAKLVDRFDPDWERVNA